MANLNKALRRWKEVIFITMIIKLLLFAVPLIFFPKSANLFTFWVHWDGPHYIDIAKNWYQTNGEPTLFIVFYPLYPLLIKFLALFLKDFSVSSILVPIFFSFISSILLFELVLLDFDKRIAFLSVWFLNIFPTAYFLQASYTESLFLALILLSFYLYRKRAYTAAGIFGMLSSFTRVNGILLLPTLLMETRLSFKNLISFILIPFGLIAYLSINYLTFGNLFYFAKPLTETWFKKISWPWIGVQNLVNSIPNLTDPNFYIYFSELVAIIFIMLMTFIVYFKVRKSYALYMFLNLLLFTSTSYILSTPRYALSLFPIFIALALIKNRFIIISISVTFLVLLFQLTILYTQGRWAF